MLKCVTVTLDHHLAVALQFYILFLRFSLSLSRCCRAAITSSSWSFLYEKKNNSFRFKKIIKTIRHMCASKFILLLVSHSLFINILLFLFTIVLWSPSSSLHYDDVMMTNIEYSQKFIAHLNFYNIRSEIVDLNIYLIAIIVFSLFTE